MRRPGALTILCLALLLIACGGATPTATPPPTATTAPTATPATSPTATTPPTATSIGQAAGSAPATAAATASGTAAPGAASPTAGSAPTGGTSSPAATPAVATTGGGQVTDQDGMCQMTLPATFSEDPEDRGAFTSIDELAFADLSSFDSGGLSFDAVSTLFIDTFQGGLTDYQETYRSPGKVMGQEVLFVLFDGTLLGQTVKGQFYFLQGGTTVCTLTLLALPPADMQYDQAFTAMIDSLAAVKP